MLCSRPVLNWLRLPGAMGTEVDLVNQFPALGVVPDRTPHQLATHLQTPRTLSGVGEQCATDEYLPPTNSDFYTPDSCNRICL